MKHIISLALVLFALSGHAQSIHFDSSRQMSYVNIDSVQASFNDSLYCTRLYVRLFNDNLNTECSLYWELCDRFGVMHKRGNDKIVHENYTSWDGNNQYPFEYEADLLGLELND